MFYDVTSEIFCEDCRRSKNSTYSNLKRAKLRLRPTEYNDIKDDITLKSMEESWISLVHPPSHVQAEESCLFMLNFNQAGDTMVTSSVNVIDIWNFAKKEKLKSLTEHSEIVTSVEWFKSPQDNTFISCSLDKSMKIWRNYNCVQTLTHHQDWLRCMSISKDNQFLISGCVSSVIWVYDLQRQKPLFNITNRDGDANLNTINSLDFQQDSLVFLSGTRDGYIKLFDIRANSTKPFQKIFSHEMKLNSAVFGQNNNLILSAGRDSVMRLWDLRMIKDQEDSRSFLNNGRRIKGYTAEYTGHTSKGYNIAGHFFQNDKYIITGSEDGYVYIYNTQTAKLARKINAGTKIIHLLKPYPKQEAGFAYSGLQRSTIHFYDARTAEDMKPKKEIRNRVEKMGNEFSESSIKFIEDFMSENGDLILKVFHSNNITYSSGMTWDNLLKVITRQEDDDSRKLFTKLNEVLLRNMQQFMQNPSQFETSEANHDAESKEKAKAAINRGIKNPKSTCPKCKDLQIIRYEELSSYDLNCELLKNLP